jgi:serine/threonine protein kinase
VAVKLIHRELVVFARFEREARAAARLMHPAIVTLYEAAIDERGAYLVSELVRGKSLDRLLVAGRCSDRDILQIAISISGALAYAHTEGVVHRDVKPSNVIVPTAVATGVAAAAKLTDFGVARLLDDGHDSLTRTGEVIGTAAYMAPEQAQGSLALPSSDLYSLALVTYEGLTGVNPLRGARGRPLNRRQAAVYLPPLRRQRRDLPDELARAVDRALSPRPSNRGSVDQFSQALEASLGLVGDTPGVVAPRGWLALRHRVIEPDEPRLHDEAQRFMVAPSGRSFAAADRPDPRAAGTPAGSTRDQRLLRVINAALAALAVWWVSRHLLSEPPIPPAAAAAAACVATMLVPRLAFAVLAALMTGLTATQGRPGAAALLALVAWLTIAAMPFRGAPWNLPGGAVVLGTISLGGAWPAIAARSGARWWLRAAASGVGFIWLAAAAALVGSPLYEHLSTHPAAPQLWTTSPMVSVREVASAMVHSGVIAGAVVWALAAAAAPVLMSGRRGTAIRAGIAVAWAGATILATLIAMRALAGGSLIAPRGWILGGALGAMILAAPMPVTRKRPLSVSEVVP